MISLKIFVCILVFFLCISVSSAFHSVYVSKEIDMHIVSVSKLIQPTLVLSPRVQADDSHHEFANANPRERKRVVRKRQKTKMNSQRYLSIGYVKIPGRNSNGEGIQSEKSYENPKCTHVGRKWIKKSGGK